MAYMYSVTCLDHPDSEALRMKNRPVHLDYVRAQADKVALAGPVTSEDGATMIGTLLILNVESAAAAQDFVTHDPYHKAGLFADIRIHRFNHLLGGLKDPNKAEPNS